MKRFFYSVLLTICTLSVSSAFAAAKTILIVDDSASMRQFVKITLGGAGYNVIEVANAEVALQNLKSKPIELNLVITDLNMPNIDGITFIRILKSIPAYTSTPVVVLTTDSSDVKMKVAKLAGAQAYIMKPIQPQILIQVVKKLLG